MFLQNIQERTTLLAFQSNHTVPITKIKQCLRFDVISSKTIFLSTVTEWNSLDPTNATADHSSVLKSIIMKFSKPVFMITIILEI